MKVFRDDPEPETAEVETEVEVSEAEQSDEPKNGHVNGRAKKEGKKASKKKSKVKEVSAAMADATTEKKLRMLEIDPKTDRIGVYFDVVTTIAPEEEDGDSETSVDEFSVHSKRRPHRDLVGKIKKLVKFAMAAVEINDENVKSYSIGSLKIDGDMLMKQSRVSITLLHEVERTGKYIKIASGQITMYGESSFEDAEKMSRVIEEIEEEIFLYLKGKHEVENPDQIPLFSA